MKRPELENPQGRTGMSVVSEGMVGMTDGFGVFFWGFGTRGIQQAQLVDHVTPDLGFVGSSPTLGREMTLKQQLELESSRDGTAL